MNSVDDIRIGSKGNRIVIPRKVADEFARLVLAVRNDPQANANQFMNFIRDQVSSGIEDDKYEDVWDEIVKDNKDLTEGFRQCIGVKDSTLASISSVFAKFYIPLPIGPDWTDRFYKVLQLNTILLTEVSNVTDQAGPEFNKFKQACASRLNSQVYSWRFILKPFDHNTGNILQIPDKQNITPKYIRSLNTCYATIVCDEAGNWSWKDTTPITADAAGNNIVDLQSCKQPGWFIDNEKLIEQAKQLLTKAVETGKAVGSKAVEVGGAVGSKAVNGAKFVAGKVVDAQETIDRNAEIMRLERSLLVSLFSEDEVAKNISKGIPKIINGAFADGFFKKELQFLESQIMRLKWIDGVTDKLRLFILCDLAKYCERNKITDCEFYIGFEKFALSHTEVDDTKPTEEAVKEIEKEVDEAVETIEHCEGEVVTDDDLDNENQEQTAGDSNSYDETGKRLVMELATISDIAKEVPFEITADCDLPTTPDEVRNCTKSSFISAEKKFLRKQDVSKFPFDLVKNLFTEVQEALAMEDTSLANDLDEYKENNPEEYNDAVNAESNLNDNVTVTDLAPAPALTESNPNTPNSTNEETRVGFSSALDTMVDSAENAGNKIKDTVNELSGDVSVAGLATGVGAAGAVIGASIVEKGADAANFVGKGTSLVTGGSVNDVPGKVAAITSDFEKTKAVISAAYNNCKTICSQRRIVDCECLMKFTGDVMSLLATAMGEISSLNSAPDVPKIYPPNFSENELEDIRKAYTPFSGATAPTAKLDKEFGPYENYFTKLSPNHFKEAMDTVKKFHDIDTSESKKASEMEPIVSKKDVREVDAWNDKLSGNGSALDKMVNTAGQASSVVLDYTEAKKCRNWINMQIQMNPNINCNLSEFPKSKLTWDSDYAKTAMSEFKSALKVIANAGIEIDSEFKKYM